MTFTRENLPAIRADLEKVLQEFAKKHKLVTSVGKITFMDNEFSCKLNVSTLESNPNAVDPRLLSDLIANGVYCGLSTNMIGTKLVLPGSAGRSNFEFIGMRASKAVTKCLDDGKSYRWDAKFIAKQIELQGKKA